MIHPILAYGDPILKLKASNISTDETNDLGPLIKDLWETMYNANGVGIAAPQIGISKAIFVADFSYFKDEESFREQELINMQQVFINPEIIEKSGEIEYEEGCLSVPNYYENVKRANEIKVSALNELGQPFKIDADEMLSICIQHEMDHLKGILFVDHLSKLKQKRLRKKAEKQSKKL